MKHPKENFKDQRGKSDQDISKMFNRKRGSSSHDEGGMQKRQQTDKNYNEQCLEKAIETPLPDDELDLSDADEVEASTRKGKGNSDVAEKCLVTSGGRNDSDDGSVRDSPAASDSDQWVEYVDALGRARSCMKKDFPSQHEKDSNEAKEENNNTAEFHDLLSKLTPLANLDEATVSKLVENIEALSKMDLKESALKESKSEEKVADAEKTGLNGLLYTCKSIEDITSKFQEFEYDEEKEGIICCVCSLRDPSPLNNNQNIPFSNTGFFKFKSWEQGSSGLKQTSEFRHLKHHLKRHLASNSHEESYKYLQTK